MRVRSQMLLGDVSEFDMFNCTLGRPTGYPILQSRQRLSLSCMQLVTIPVSLHRCHYNALELPSAR